MRKKRRTNQEERIDETWLIPYSDLLTLLLALFIVLFASSIIDQKKLEQIGASFSDAFNTGVGFFTNTGSSLIELPEELSAITERERNTPAASDEGKVDESDVKAYLAKKLAEETQQLSELKTELDIYIQESGLDSQLKTALNNHQLLITFSDTALFDPASAELKPQAEQLARSIGEMLAKYPDYAIMVSGHTDNVPINNWRYPSNWELSTARAVNFMKVLLESDIDPSRVSAAGYGEYNPVADNDTPEGRAANRRVEVSIVRNYLTQQLTEAILEESN